MSYTTDTQFEQALAQLDLAPIMSRVGEETGLDEQDLAKAEALYRQFLTLKHKYADKSIVPTKLVDEVWHTHIMFTRKYMADCEALFGLYVHHNPEATDDEVEEGIENSKILHKQEFGVDLPVIAAVRTSQFDFSGFGGCN